MGHIQIRAVLDYVAMIAMIAASIVLVVVAVDKPSKAVTDYAPGQSFTVPSVTIPHEPGTRVLLLFLKTDCPYCAASVSFYRTLRQRARVTRLVVIGYEPENILRSHYVGQEGVPFDGVVSVPPGQTRFRGTPTLLLLNAKSVVQKVWRGKLSANEEKEVLAVID